MPPSSYYANGRLVAIVRPGQNHSKAWAAAKAAAERTDKANLAFAR